MSVSFIDQDYSVRPLWLPDLRKAFEDTPGAERVVLRLSRGNAEDLDFEIWIPAAESEGDRALVSRFVTATAYNILSVYSGREICFFCSPAVQELIADVPDGFLRHPGLNKVVKIAQRIHGSLTFSFRPLSEYYVPLKGAKTASETPLAEKLRSLIGAAENACCVGVDVGGSDIKIAASVKGRLVYTEEYNWNPESSPTAEGIIEPILQVICRARERIEQTGNRLAAIGLSFPDIVIDDSIVGGETPKTKGIRENPDADTETELMKIRELKTRLLSLCSPGGSVRIINDGNMAAFTAAVELAAGGDDEEISKGVLAHSLGTELGTGWLQADGTIPAIPLEMYDLLLDLGSHKYAELPPEDLRSTCNENSRMPGVRRYLGQAGVYRLAWRQCSGLLREYTVMGGDVLKVPTKPEDLRKPCLEHIMQLAADRNPDAEEVFREIGQNLAVVTREINWLLGETPPKRVLFGRFVKSPRCFELLREGFEEAGTGIELEAADDNLANTSLMRQLAAAPDVTVAQFGQAVGAIYFSMNNK